eukprot:4337907-Amphidinium_carterae.1
MRTLLVFCKTAHVITAYERIAVEMMHWTVVARTCMPPAAVLFARKARRMLVEMSYHQWFAP